MQLGEPNGQLARGCSIGKGRMKQNTPSPRLVSLLGTDREIPLDWSQWVRWEWGGYQSLQINRLFVMGEFLSVSKQMSMSLLNFSSNKWGERNIGTTYLTGNDAKISVRLKLKSIDQLINQWTFYSTNIPAEGRLSDLTAESVFNSKINEAVL